MTRTITRLFDNRAQAEAAVRDLEAAGISHSDLSIVAAQGADGRENRSFLDKDADGDGENDAAEGAAKGATTGGLLGGGAGLLAGLGLLAIPGLGPVVAAGWLASTAVGAVVGATAGGVTGGLLGALKDAGVSDDDAHVYAEGVRRGGAIVSARVDDSQAARVEQLLNQNSGVDAISRRELYTSEGWTRFDPDAPYGGTVGGQGRDSDRLV
jgi:hypothetical protein